MVAVMTGSSTSSVRGDDGLVAQVFTELICADQEWVDEEFAAIVTACGEVPPPSVGVVLTGPGRGRGPAAVFTAAEVGGAPAGAAATADRGHGRQRSPPGTG